MAKQTFNNKKTQEWISLIIIFLISLIIRLEFNFAWPHTNNFAACDAYEYISNSQTLIDVASNLPNNFWPAAYNLLLSGNTNLNDKQIITTSLAPLKGFGISGPIFPLFLALIALVSENNPAKVNVHQLWPVLIAVQSILSALTCLNISLIARLCFDRKTSLIAGIVATFYPAFIVNSGRLYSETFATFLLSSLSVFLIQSFRSSIHAHLLAFNTGLLAACLQLSRSTMAALSLVLIPLTLLKSKNKSRLIAFLCLVSGFIIVCFPWLAFQKLAFGSGGLIVNRVGQYNCFIGNNVETLGWLSYPYPDGRGVEEKSFPKLLTDAIKSSPARWFRLMLDKPLRLFKFPWNDFRTNIGPIDFNSQVIYQELILLFSFFGIAQCFRKSAIDIENKSNYNFSLTGRFFLLFIFCFHFIYFFFITVPRYNLTAMPALIIFAAAGISFILSGFLRNKIPSLIVSSICLLFFCSLRFNFIQLLSSYNISAPTALLIQSFFRILLFYLFLFFSYNLLNKGNTDTLRLRIFTIVTGIILTPLFLLALRANGRWYEWYIDLDRHNSIAHQKLILPKSELAHTFNSLTGTSLPQFYLLLDNNEVDQFENNWQLKLNGEILQGPILASMSLIENFDHLVPTGDINTFQREGEYIWNSLCTSASINMTDLRQWSIIAIPEKILKEAVQKSSSKMSDPNIVLELEISAKNELRNQAMRIFGNFNCNQNLLNLPSLVLYSWEKSFYGVESPNCFSDSRYETKKQYYNEEFYPKNLANTNMQNFRLNTLIVKAPPISNENKFEKIKEFDLGKQYIKGQKNKIDIHYPIDCSDNKDETIWILSLKGKARSYRTEICPSVNLEIIYGDDPTIDHVSEFKTKNLKQDSQNSHINYRSPWIPQKLLSKARDPLSWQDFRIAVPVKPFLKNKRAKEVLFSLSACPKDSNYLNIYTNKTNPDSPILFSDLKFEIYRIPANPLGLGHKVI